MRIPRVYSPQPIEVNTSLLLDAQASHHILRVLRLKVGAKITLFNGEGGEYSACITSTQGKIASVNIDEYRNVDRETPLDLHLVQGICRGEKMDFAIQKSVELGVSRITPALTMYGNIKLTAERAQKRQHHWQQIANSACEQCGRTRTVAIDLPMPLSALFDRYSSKSENVLKLVLDPHGQSLNEIEDKKKGHIVFVIGPEGGLSEEELQFAKTHGFFAVRLGARILRSETAPLAALAAINLMWGDF